MQLAIDKLNEAGGINGRKLKLLFEQASTPAESVAYSWYAKAEHAHQKT
jgi:ABC-type branched-subunit amino acid transport system substrate-binding protein